LKNVYENIFQKTSVVNKKNITAFLFSPFATIAGSGAITAWVFSVLYNSITKKRALERFRQFFYLLPLGN
jgi:cytochrome c oxidase assembly factor CtaG